MKFKKYKRGTDRISSERNIVYLNDINWDDFSFVTSYTVYYQDKDGLNHQIGTTKIGQIGLVASPEFGDNLRSPKLPEGIFDSLPINLFSLGQDSSFYENLIKIAPNERESILLGLRDVAFDEELFEKVRYEEVTLASLLRGVSEVSVEGQFRRLARGLNELIDFSFNYSFPHKYFVANTPLKFEVRPQKMPPSNIHVIIGQNSVGKTRLLNSMINSIVHKSFDEHGVLELTDSMNKYVFANLISVSFSAFDNKTTIPFSTEIIPIRDIKFTYVGIKNFVETEPLSTKMPNELSADFKKSLEQIDFKNKTKKWIDYLKPLTSDESFIFDFLTYKSEGIKLNLKQAENFFDELSSGHKIILLTLTKIIELIEEKSLILIDEPETHLHPPLLSKFMQVLNNILRENNGVCITATHSPVVVQEVPKKCVWILRRHGDNMNAYRPSIETYGENVGVLTREIFSLEIMQSGYHHELVKATNKFSDFEEIMDYFNDSLGGEAQAIVRVLLKNKDA